MANQNNAGTLITHNSTFRAEQDAQSRRRYNLRLKKYFEGLLGKIELLVLLDKASKVSNSLCFWIFWQVWFATTFGPHPGCRCL